MTRTRLSVARAWVAEPSNVYHVVAFAGIVLASTILWFTSHASAPVGGYIEPPVDPRAANVENLRLGFILAAVLLLTLSFFRETVPPRMSRISISKPARLTLLLCFFFGLILSQGERPEITLVYILGFAALIIGGQHLVEFEEAKEKIDALNTQIQRTTTTLKKEVGTLNTQISNTGGNLTEALEQTSNELKRQVGTVNAQLTETGEALTQQLATSITRIGELNQEIASHIGYQVMSIRYDRYRDLVTKAYRSAKSRVLASANHWPIDPQFWSPSNASLDLENEAFWEHQTVYANLRHSLLESWTGPEDKRLQIVFAGRLDVIPPFEKSPALSEDNFLLFLGVLWRLALARKLRKAVIDPNAKESTEVPVRPNIRVVVADLPISAHIIDNDVFLLQSKAAVGQQSSWGLQIADGNNTDTPHCELAIETANTFAAIVDRYTRRNVRSAREYAASLLVFASISRGDKKDLELLDEDGHPDRENIKGLLNTLGMEAWAKTYTPFGDLFKPTPDALSDRATDLAGYFLQHYYAVKKLAKLRSRQVYWEKSDREKYVTIDRLIEDII